MLGPHPRAAAWASSPYAPAGSERCEAHGSDFRNMPEGMTCQDSVGRPKVTGPRPRAAACAATDSPYGPAPTTTRSRTGFAFAIAFAIPSSVFIAG
ncbi:hypothetical protein SNE510_43860 [Streptomyces sp. NE5-10]|nr:hypothetical protein SNE510_43860 [Streptomyces sp. NE5-10]